MCIALLVSCLLVKPSEGDQLTRSQILDLLQQVRAPIRDYECTYEGQLTRLKAPDFTGWPDSLRKANERDMAMDAGAVTTFQGTYAYRNDKAIHVDVSVRHPDPRLPLKREIFCSFKGKGSKRVIVPDQGGPSGPDVVQTGGMVFVKKALSHLRVDMYPYLLEALRNDFIPCESPGWEDVDGQRCLVVDFPRRDGKGKRFWGERFWVDVARGAIVLKYEWDDDGSVSSRLTEVGVSREHTQDGQLVWMPVGGRILYYRDLFTPSTSVHVEALYTVLQGTLRINQDLPDSRFTLDYNLDATTRAAATAANRSKTNRRIAPPVDAETSVRKVLRDPDDPSKQLVASSPSSSSWFFRNLTSVGLVVAGICVACGGIYLKRRT
jgi:hypothetical protein